MFGTANSLNEFKKWASNIEALLSVEPCVNFMVAYASLERYLFRTALALKVFHGEPSVSARSLIKQKVRNLKLLIDYCSDPKQGGHPDLQELLSNMGLNSKGIETYKTARDKIVHGADIGDRKDNEKSAKLLWKGLRHISELEFGDNGSHPKAPYQAWQRLPVRRRETANKTA